MIKLIPGNKFHRPFSSRVPRTLFSKESLTILNLLKVQAILLRCFQGIFFPGQRNCFLFSAEHQEILYWEASISWVAWGLLLKWKVYTFALFKICRLCSCWFLRAFVLPTVQMQSTWLLFNNAFCNYTLHWLSFTDTFLQQNWKFFRSFPSIFFFKSYCKLAKSKPALFCVLQFFSGYSYLGFYICHFTGMLNCSLTFGNISIISVNRCFYSLCAIFWFWY